MTCQSKKRNHLVTLAGFSMLLSGIGLLVLQSALIDYIQTSILIIKPDSLILDLWKKFPDALNINLYMFNWTNHQDFLNKSINSRFEELGPYAIQMFTEKVHVVFNDNNDTVTFKSVFTFYYDAIKNRGNMSDQVTTINYLSLLLSQFIVKEQDFFMRNLAKMLLLSMDSEVHISKTVDEHTLKGYQNFILDMARFYPAYHPEIPRFDEMGIFKMRNGSEDLNGIFNIRNGARGNFDMVSWNYMNMTPYFEEPCSHIKGSVGDLFSRNVQRKKPLYMFVSDICRYIRFDYVKEDYVEGVLGYKYIIGHGSLDNGTLVPENACFCQGNCMPYGVVNASSCRWGFELYISLPHFFLADPCYLKGIEGMEPRKEKHDSYLIIEPTTFVVLKADIKAQLNVRTLPVEDLPVFSNIPEVFFPIFWVQLNSKLPELVMTYLKIFLSLPYIINVLGVFLGILGLCCVVPIAYRKKAMSVKTRRKERRKVEAYTMVLLKFPLLRSRNN